MVTWAKGGKKINNSWLVCNSIKKHLFQAFSAISGYLFAEEGCTDTIAYWKTLWIPSLLRMELVLDEFLCCRQSDVVMHSFCLLPSMEQILVANRSLLYFPVYNRLKMLATQKAVRHEVCSSSPLNFNIWKHQNKQTTWNKSKNVFISLYIGLT